LKNKKIGIEVRKMSELQNTPYKISFISGKGGVGKSVLASNIAYVISQMNSKVLIWDANRKFPNTHLFYGVEPPIRLGDVYKGIVPVEKAIFKINENLHILSDEPATFSDDEEDKFRFDDIYRDLIKKTSYDYIIFDTPAGLNNINVELALISDLNCLVITDEPTSLLDGYALIKVLREYMDIDKIKLVVNNTIDYDDGSDIATKMNLATEKFLGFKAEVIGIIPYSRIVRQSIIKQEIFVQTDPDEEISQAIREFCGLIFRRTSRTFLHTNEIVN